MNTIRAFGVGCFHFGYRRNIPYKFITADYVDETKKALGALSSLSELEISFLEDMSDSFEVEDELQSLIDGDYFPHVYGLEIRFNLFIPFRIQSELFPTEADGLRTTTEQFRVTALHSFYGPVTFIECLDAKVNCSPSDAVRLVRVYLEREFKKLVTPVTFEYLGPSPFHADFYLKQSVEETTEIQIEEKKLRGYNEITFSYSATLSNDDVIAELYDELSHELGLFYDIQRRAVLLMTDGEKLTEKWQKLQSISNPGPSFYDLLTRIRIHREAQALVSDAYTLQARFTVEEQQVLHGMASIYDRGTPTYLESYVLNRSEKLPSYPVESILRWAEHIESASFKRAEIAAMVLSAIGGGVVGSLITLLMSGGK